MKAIMMSIRPQWVEKILNKEKTLEIRKRFPKDYVGWVYIYCTKEDNLCCIKKISRDRYICGKDFEIKDFPSLSSGYDGKGKVVARFWCDKVEEITFYPKKPFDRYGTPYRATYDLLTESCLEYDELDNYLNKNSGYAIHITKLEIFDKPKEIGEFERKETIIAPYMNYKSWDYLPLTRAPQSYCYIEI